MRFNLQQTLLVVLAVCYFTMLSTTLMGYFMKVQLLEVPKFWRTRLQTGKPAEKAVILGLSPVLFLLAALAACCPFILFLGEIAFKAVGTGFAWLFEKTQEKFSPFLAQFTA
ncbi:MAG: hypothetical protein WCT37_00475 [Patescibacteria group bacterium]|jgi:hypothetical protein